MSNDICVWKSNTKFNKEDAASIFGELMERNVKPTQIDATDQIAEFVKSLTDRYPPLESDNPSSAWASSFYSSDWHFTVSMSYDSEAYVDVFMDMQSLCENMGLTIYDSGSGDLFP